MVVAVGRLAMHIYREFRAELHKAYKKMLEKCHDPKQCPYDMQRAAQWIWLIENKWETHEWKAPKLYLVWVCVWGGIAFGFGFVSLFDFGMWFKLVNTLLLLF